MLDRELTIVDIAAQFAGQTVTPDEVFAHFFGLVAPHVAVAYHRKRLARRRADVSLTGQDNATQDGGVRRMVNDKLTHAYLAGKVVRTYDCFGKAVFRILPTGTTVPKPIQRKLLKKKREQ